MFNAQLVRAALQAATLDDAERLQAQLAVAIGAEHPRPLGDRWNNHGLMGQSGSFDLKLIEQLTNMQDGVLERLALLRFGAATVPYETPHAAAADLLKDVPPSELSELATVRFVESNGNPAKSKRLTAVFRDRGCGLVPVQVPKTIFQLGGRLKEDRLWQQGAFGLGGATTYRNARAVVLVTRRDPGLLAASEQDRITVAVVLWKQMTKGTGAYYLVTEPWNEPGDHATPWSCPAAEVPEFVPGTHLALISYGVEGIHRKHEGDERSFDTIANTRLFKPVMPVQFRNETDRGRNTKLTGLHQRLTGPRDEAMPTEDLIVPFGDAGVTYDLPVSYYLFNEPRAKGGRDKFVAHDHVVVFTSNGQVHHHWTRSEFKARTKLNKLADRVFVVVETDSLPIKLRTALFTADRAGLVRTDPALRLEETISAALNDWEALQEENNKLIREALRGGDQLTLEIARKISRVLDIRGFRPDGGAGASGGTGGSKDGGGAPGGKLKEIDLKLDPTYVDGPSSRTVEIGKTAFVTFYVDVVDEFWERGRGKLSVESDHVEIGSEEIRIGKGRNGRVSVTVAVPETATAGTEELRLTLADWHRASGGLGPTLTHTCKLELVDQLDGSGIGAGKAGAGKKGNQGPTTGSLVALRWTNPGQNPGWQRGTVGEVEEVRAAELAASSSTYAELTALGDQTVPVILLNEEYPPLTKYLFGRAKKLTDLTRPKDQYAIGVGVELILMYQEVKRRQEKGAAPADEDLIRYAHLAAAQAVLAVMPAADELARQAGFDDE